MVQSLISGWALGLATGTTCLGTCAPIYIPYLIAEKRSGKQSFFIILKITLGRFLSYIAFGAAFGFIGSKIPYASREIFTGLAYILLSIYLVASVFRIRKHSDNCKNMKLLNLTKNPFFLGILTGVSFCPAFLIAVSNAIDISGIMGGATLFVGFFLGTTIFILPMTFLGALSNSTKIRKIAQIASIIIAVFFIYKGTTSLVHFRSQIKRQNIEINDNQLAKPFMETEKIFIFTDTEENRWDLFVDLINKDSIEYQFVKLNDLSSINDNGSIITTINESKSIPADIGYKIIKIDIINFKSTEDFEKLIKFLTNIYFRYDQEKGYSFKIAEPPGGLVN